MVPGKGERNHEDGSKMEAKARRKKGLIWSGESSHGKTRHRIDYYAASCFSSPSRSLYTSLEQFVLAPSHLPLFIHLRPFPYSMPDMMSISQPQQRQFNPYSENGGTILAIAGADFSVIAGDTRQSEGYSIQTRYAPKVFRLCVTLSLSRPTPIHL